MPKRVPLPPDLGPLPFHYSTARSLGVGEGRLRSLDAPFHGVRSLPRDRERPTSDLESTLTQCLNFAPLLTPGRFFSHVTAARIWECPVPNSANDGLLHVSSMWPANAPRGRGVAGHQARPETVRVIPRFGFPVSDSSSTWIALAQILPLDELVACGDHLVLIPSRFDPSDPRPHVVKSELEARAAEFHGRGASAVHRAITLVRVGAESRPETLFRLLLDRAGFPPPELNMNVFDAANRFLGRADMFWPMFRTVVEYDGDGHRVDTAQYDKDITRVDDFVAAGFNFVRVRRLGLFDRPTETIERVERALSRGGWRRQTRRTAPNRRS